MGAVTDPSALAVPSLGEEKCLMVNLPVPTFLLHPWLKAGIAPAGMKVSETGCTSLLSSGTRCCDGALAFQQIRCLELQQFWFLFAVPFIGWKPGASKSTAPHCGSSSLLLQLCSLGKPQRCSGARTVPLQT